MDIKKYKSILIIGGTGFLGYHIAKACLKLKWNVVSLSLNKPKKIRKLKRIKYIILNISIKKNLNKLNNYQFNYVINLATKWIDKHNYKDLIDVINSNILFNTAVLDVVPKKNLHKFINVSTYGLFKTSKKYNPINLYAATKKSFEDIIVYYQNNHKKTYFYNLYLYDNYDK